jgi:hypothetical protein
MHWTTFLYHFGVGGIILALGLWTIVKTGACRLRSPKERLWFGALIAGYLWLFGIYFFWIQAGLHL